MTNRDEVHPFEVGMEVDRVVEIAKRRKMWRVAKNKIVGIARGRYTVKWFFENCTLVVGWDSDEPPYRIQEILPPLHTGKRLSAKQSMPTTKQIRRAAQKFGVTEGAR